ncbi:hypothetical protein V8F20_010655, partial [Naviculisporaceae sp. PSN 640]
LDREASGSHTNLLLKTIYTREINEVEIGESTKRANRKRKKEVIIVKKKKEVIVGNKNRWKEKNLKNAGAANPYINWRKASGSHTNPPLKLYKRVRIIGGKIVKYLILKGIITLFKYIIIKKYFVI